MESKLKHLEMIQAIINRMGSNSFVFKGWSITIVAGVTTLAAANAKPHLLIVSGVATALFWGVDAYYLMLEREYRELYRIVAKKKNDDIDFLMDVPGITITKWLKVMFTRPVLFIYYILVLIFILATITITIN